MPNSVSGSARRSKRTRRTLLAATAFAALFAATTIQAAAPQVKTQQPGFYRLPLGAFEVTTLLDGTVDFNVGDLFHSIKPAELQALLARANLQPAVESSVNAFLINTGPRLVLVDSGAGTFFGPTLGNILASLKAAGYAPEQVDDVLITHMHGDHIGGLIRGGQRAFPNAVVHVDKHDANYWLGAPQANAEAASEFKQARSAFQPYIDAKKFQTFEAGEQIVPGVGSISAHGHTAGHTVYVAESNGQKLVLWGDLLHVAAVQFPRPTDAIDWDSDAKAAVAARAQAMAEAAAQNYWVGVAHVPFPGLGHVRAEGTGYVWVPANYSVNR